jgi:protein-tyrosine-phosphatase
VLFLCTRDSARSQIAEGLLRKLSRGRADVFSAGTRPEAEVHPLAADVLKTRFQVDTDDLYPKHLNRFIGQVFDFVITVVIGRRRRVQHSRETRSGFTGASRILLPAKMRKRVGAPLSSLQTAWQLACESGWRSRPCIGGLAPRKSETGSTTRTVTGRQCR